MVLISALTAIFFLRRLGVTVRRLDVPRRIGTGFLREGSFFWLFAKIAFFMYTFFWLRATFPRYRYDQIMRLGWKVFIPITIIWIAVEGAMAWFEIGPWAGLSG